MSTYLDTLQDRLVAASRELARGRRRWKRRGGAAVALVLVLGAPALAASGVWRPPLGRGEGLPPRISASSPPADQLALLSVLRRPQTAADRAAPSLYALKFVGSLKGIRTDSVRLLAPPSDKDRGIVLVPAQRYTQRSMRLPADTPPAERAKINRPPIADPLCLYQLDSDGAGAGCFSTADVREGRVWMSLGHRLLWLVPDGVVRVRSEFAGKPTVEGTVRGNLALYTVPRAMADRTTFLDAAGKAVRVIDAPKGPRTAPALTDPVAPGATHSGGVRRIAISGSGLDARYELWIRTPKVRFAPVTVILERPACAGKRTVTEEPGAGSRRSYQLTIHPSTGDFDRARWCPGTYRGTLRLKRHGKPFGTFSFRI